jgi:hypothetical protein
MFYVGCDLGQAQDYTALVVVENADDSLYVRHIERLPLGTYYPDQVERIKRLVSDERLQTEVTTYARQEFADRSVYGSWQAPQLTVGPKPMRPPELVVDATGAGRPVVDMMRREGLQFAPVLITGGDAEHAGGGFHRVPKRNLVSSVQVGLQTGALVIHPDLGLAETLRKELLNFRIKVNIATGHDSYEARREGDHDDLVLAVALACWGAERKPQGAAVYSF